MHRNRVPTQRVMAAFTLIELLVVIAIIALLAAILFPVFAKTREKARQATCLSNQKQIAAATLMYISDYDETFPFVLNFSGNCDYEVTNLNDDGKGKVVPGATGREPQFQHVTVVAPYVKSQNVWYCPSVGPDATWESQVKEGGWKRGATMRTQGTSYGYIWAAWPYPYTGRWLSEFTFLGGKSIAILREPSRWPMLCDEPDGWSFDGNLADPPAKIVPHTGGLNIAYGDGHVRYHHLEIADGSHYLFAHVGDGLYPGQ